jgi:hypothetical protein
MRKVRGRRSACWLPSHEARLDGSRDLRLPLRVAAISDSALITTLTKEAPVFVDALLEVIQQCFASAVVLRGGVSQGMISESAFQYAVPNYRGMQVSGGTRRARKPPTRAVAIFSTRGARAPCSLALEHTLGEYRGVMSEKIKAALINAIAPGVITALGALALGVYQERSHTHDVDLETIRAAASASAQARQMDQSIRDQNKRDQVALMHDLAPRVAGATGTTANCPWVVGLWQSAYPDSPAPALSDACPSVPSPPPQHWMVSAGTDPSSKVACSLAVEAGAKSLPEPRVFERPINGRTEYITTIGDYAARSDAEPIAAATRNSVRFYASVILNPGWKPYTCPSS